MRSCRIRLWVSASVLRLLVGDESPRVKPVKRLLGASLVGFGGLDLVDVEIVRSESRFGQSQKPSLWTGECFEPFSERSLVALATSDPTRFNATRRSEGINVSMPWNAVPVHLVRRREPSDRTANKVLLAVVRRWKPSARVANECCL